MNEKIFMEVIALKRQGLLGEIVAENLLEILGNEIRPMRLQFTADMMGELGRMFLKTSEKIKEIANENEKIS